MVYIMSRVIPLFYAEPGRKYKVISFVRKGFGWRRRLEEIGFVPGQVFEVVFNNRGYIVVEIRGSRFGISPVIARKIFIEGVNSEIRA